MNRFSLLSILTTLVLFIFCQSYGKSSKNGNTVTFCNPLNLSYRFSLDNPSRREGADPTIIQFKGLYYLFLSKSGGYFCSSDLLNWKLINTNDLPLEDYAPTAITIGDSVYFLACSVDKAKIYATNDPSTGKWNVASEVLPFAVLDPALFQDDDKRLYLYYGCSDNNPIQVVELDPKNRFKIIGKNIPCIYSNPKVYGWEQKGDYNDQPGNPWIEGSWMNKVGEKYYLQYAAPGTEYKSYSDGVYVSDGPTGPFKISHNNPFSYKPEGFIAGAGHGSTFRDIYGNYWHIATMTISQKHQFERRIGLFPVFLDKGGEMHANTGFGDYPITLPHKKISNPIDFFTGWMMLSYNKPVEVSSQLDGFPGSYAVDENIKTYWSAQSGKKGEWIIVNLLNTCTIKAIQINYAEQECNIHGRLSEIQHKYLIEYSMDRKNWQVLIDKSSNTTDIPHDYVELKKSVNAKYIRLTNYYVPDGNFAISGLRIFGKGFGPLPERVKQLKACRQKNDPRVVRLEWEKVPGAICYNIRYGTNKSKLYQNYQIYSNNSVTIRSLNSNLDYFFSIECFNENGITKGNEIVTSLF